MRLCAVVAALGALLGSGCKNLLGIESGVVADGNAGDGPDDSGIPFDAPIDMPIDARTCFGTFQQICLTQPVPDTFHVTTATPITTCTETQTVGGVDICIRSAKHIVVNAGASINTLSAAFVVLVATEDIVLNGTLDLWNSGSTTCATPQGGFAGGGPGGSFGGLGGVGTGVIVNTQPTPVPTTITTFRRGCAGSKGGSDAQGGDGGAGGSGIFLVSPSIHLTSTARINASGNGGAGGTNDRGGGGGGSGGFVLFDSETLQIDAGAIVLAVGGGGGGGGAAGTAMSGTRATTIDGAMPGQGGRGNAAASGDGGDGGLQGAGMPGGLASNNRGSGGGGGGTGVIFATALNPANNGTVAPTLRAP